ncbi:MULTISPECIES: ABC transporter ATP-binding protein [Halomicrobium]|uniref:ABC transporter related n=2 Tax=Halomicrobium mukohataei TaxID=57705 RepID=C7P130_HALMD|nr:MULTISPECIES: ABC transporter ATP-binding protein [Halomicrobium]ACV49045.1 ABC transporter related [Halomicrobium mukohataei DSM 12286]QCD64465.1 ABC transporter ATP-binding protein [Halomicrobium mukohataei]QFR19271.1 ATP-binding cassette domain-containing protein [Halomicrobium sp. ZPS1]
MTPSAIETDGLTKQYGDSTALSELDLTVERGEVYGFLGPNGAGKSTTINLLLNYIKPTAGTARVLGHDPWNDVVACHQRVGICPDRFDTYDDLSARRHLELVIDTKRADDTPRSLLERVGLVDAIDKPAGEFSQGMEQRLALAMSLVGDPDLLVLDEPFTGLDPHGASLVRAVVEVESERGATVFFSSHVLGQVELVCDRVGILHRGRLVAEGSLAELRDRCDLSADATIEAVFMQLTGDSVRTEEVDR